MSPTDPIVTGSAVAVAAALSVPVNTLIKKISNAIGMVYEPIHTVRMANAEATAERAKTLSAIENASLSARADRQLKLEAMNFQMNMESVIEHALPLITEDACPENLEDDWLVNFFQKSRLVSDEKMQDVWARVLAGEANTPGSFSRRTVNLLNDLDRHDATKFEIICRFVCSIDEDTDPWVLDTSSDFYRNNGINMSLVMHLNSLNLIQHTGLGSLLIETEKQQVQATYFDQKFSVILGMPGEEKYKLNCGKVAFTKAGKELMSLVHADPVSGFVAFLAEKMHDEGNRLIIS